MNTNKPASLTDQGIMLLQLRKYSQAEKKFAEALVYKSNDSLALYGLGKSLIEQGKIRQGKNELEKGLALFPNNALFIEELTVLQLNKGNYSQSEHLAKQWLQRHPTSAKAYAMMGKICLRKKSPDKKTVFYYLQEALKIDPFCLDALDGMASAYWDLNKDKESAIQEYRRAITHYPNNAVIHNNFGVILLQSGEGKQAIEEFRQAIRLNPSLPMAANNILQALALTHPAYAWIYKINIFLYASTWRRVVIMLILYIFARGLLLLYILYLFFAYKIIISQLKKNG